jgi:hypothetical protein
MTEEKTNDNFLYNTEDRYPFETYSFYGNIFYNLRQYMIKTNTKEEIEEIIKLMEELEYPYFKIKAHKTLSKFTEKMSFMDTVNFRQCLGMITIQVVKKKDKLISLLDIKKRKISLKQAFQELNQKDKDWYNLLIKLQNKITLFKSNR